MRFSSHARIVFAVLMAAVLVSSDSRMVRRATDPPKPGSKLSKLHKIFMHDHHGGKVDFQSVQLVHEAQTLNPSEFGNDGHQTMVSEAKTITDDSNRGADGCELSRDKPAPTFEVTPAWNSLSSWFVFLKYVPFHRCAGPLERSKSGSATSVGASRWLCLPSPRFVCCAQWRSKESIVGRGLFPCAQLPSREQ